MSRVLRRAFTFPGVGPANGRPGIVNIRRARRVHERLDDSASWRFWLADRDLPGGWVPDLDDEDGPDA